MRIVKAMGLAAALVLGFTQAPKADVIYTFTQTGNMQRPVGSPFPGPVNVQTALSLVVTDAAYNDGFRVQGGSSNQAPPLCLHRWPDRDHPHDHLTAKPR